MLHVSSYGSVLRRPGKNEIHVWIVDTGHRSGPGPGGAGVRNEARAMAYAILAGYLGTTPDRLGFAYGEYGKPSLGPGFDCMGTRFNISHAPQRVLLAVSTELELGVDVERCRRVLHADRLAARYFSPEEHHRFLGLSPEQRREGFVAGWTRTEALAKARGTGIFRAARPVDLGPAGSVSRWSLYDLHAGEEYRAALAVEGTSHTVKTCVTGVAQHHQSDGRRGAGLYEFESIAVPQRNTRCNISAGRQIAMSPGDGMFVPEGAVNTSL